MKSNFKFCDYPNRYSGQRSIIQTDFLTQSIHSQRTQSALMIALRFKISCSIRYTCSFYHSKDQNLMKKVLQVVFIFIAVWERGHKNYEKIFYVTLKVHSLEQHSFYIQKVNQAVRLVFSQSFYEEWPPELLQQVIYSLSRLAPSEQRRKLHTPPMIHSQALFLYLLSAIRSIYQYGFGFQLICS